MYSNEKAKQILTLALEIEGLALLIQRRGDLVNPEVNYILRDKASSLLSLTEEMAGSCIPVTSDAISPEESSDDSGCIQTAAAPCVSMTETSVESDDSAIAESAVEEEVADSNVAEAAEERAAVHAAASSPVTESNQHVQPVFTLNDRFRFIRELFKGNSQDFNDTLKQLSSMTSADEVVEYLTDDLCLDPENQDVADFTAIVTQRFD